MTVATRMLFIVSAIVPGGVDRVSSEPPAQYPWYLPEFVPAQLELDEIRAVTVVDDAAPGVVDELGTQSVVLGFGAQQTTQSVTITISTRKSSFGDLITESESSMTTNDGIDFHVHEWFDPYGPVTELWWSRDGYQFLAVGYGSSEPQTDAMLRMATTLTPASDAEAANAYASLLSRWLAQPVLKQVTFSDGTVATLRDARTGTDDAFVVCAERGGADCFQRGPPSLIYGRPVTDMFGVVDMPRGPVVVGYSHIPFGPFTLPDGTPAEVVAADENSSWALGLLDEAEDITILELSPSRSVVVQTPGYQQAHP